LKPKKEKLKIIKGKEATSSWNVHPWKNWLQTDMPWRLNLVIWCLWLWARLFLFRFRYPFD
jgi:hypothetical protein